MTASTTLVEEGTVIALLLVLPYCNQIRLDPSQKVLKLGMDVKSLNAKSLSTKSLSAKSG